MTADKTEILIVDDSPTICATLAKYLGDGYSVHFAGDGDEGWKLLQANESISLVFADMHMPVMNGMQLLQNIRESDCERIANVPVIIITGHEDSEAAKKATHNLGATDFISKPFDKVDIQSRASSYTKFNKQINELEKKAAYDTLTGLYNNNMLRNFGNKTVSLAMRHGMTASIIYIEIAEIQKLVETHGSKLVGSVISTVAELLEKSLRTEELISRIKDGRFAIVLPKTTAFKAHIVATRLKQKAEELVFEICGNKHHISLAAGLCSTEYGNESSKLDFEEYCVFAAHALATSLESPNCRVVRYDETYEKKLVDDKQSYVYSTPSAAEIKTDENEEMDAFGEFFSSILAGDYSNIPPEFLPSLAEPLENFLEYIHANTGVNKKASSGK
jgi:diguanylate cyclase (GGDEF)-like protein